MGTREHKTILEGNKDPLGDSQIPVALYVLQKKKGSQKNHVVLDKYLKMEKEVIKQDKQR